MKLFGPNQKNKNYPPPKKFLLFWEMELSDSKIKILFSPSAKTKKIHSKKISYILGNKNTKKTSYIFSKESCSYIFGNANPNKLLTFQNRTKSPAFSLYIYIYIYIYIYFFFFAFFKKYPHQNIFHQNVLHQNHQYYNIIMFLHQTHLGIMFFIFYIN